MDIFGGSGAWVPVEAIASMTLINQTLSWLDRIGGLAWREPEKASYFSADGQIPGHTLPRHYNYGISKATTILRLHCWHCISADSSSARPYAGPWRCCARCTVIRAAATEPRCKDHETCPIRDATCRRLSWPPSWWSVRLSSVSVSRKIDMTMFPSDAIAGTDCWYDLLRNVMLSFRLPRMLHFIYS